MSPWTALLALTGGFVKNAGIIAMITFIAGAIQVINATKCIDASVGKLVVKYRDNLYLVIPLLLGLFTLLGAIGINTPILAFVPLALMLGRNLGGDALVGVSIALFGMISGLSGGAFCPPSTGVAQSLVGLDTFSGWPLRVAASVALWIVSSVFLILYMRKIRKDPTKSIIYGVEGIITQVDAEEAPELTGRRPACLVVFAGGFVFVVYGATHGWGTYDAIPAIFMVTAFICGLISGFSVERIVKEFIAGAKTMSTAGIIIAFATGINTILSAGSIIHTVIHALAGLFANTSTFVAALGMYVSNLLINIILCSSSSQASTVIPIFSGVGQVLGMTQQSVVQTFNFGDGITNLVTPVSTVLMAGLGFAGIPLDRWYKFMWKWLVAAILVGAVFVSIGVAINYGPF